jgi:hypothetical protein
MFGLFKKQNPAPQAPRPSIRDTLFGDMPMTDWPPTSAPTQNLEPWKSFVLAREAMEAGRTGEAVELWKNIAQTPDLESRHYLQAWHFLRQQGVKPPQGDEKKLLGVVVEYTLKGGLDLLAAYPEHTARYYNFSGAGVIWEHPDASLDGMIDALLQAGQQVLNQIGPWDQPRPAPPPEGHIRLNFLSPAGLHFGQAAFDVLARDPLAKPTITAATALMQALVAKDEQRQRK